MNFFQNTCKPQGFGGKLMVRMMNRGHRCLSQWGFSHLAPLAAEGRNILDAGCGGGANVAMWLQNCPGSHVTGLDYSAVSVAEAQTYNRAAIRQGRCRVVQGNVADMPFEDGMFDYVSAFETIYFWPDLRQCFGEVYRVLKRGGRFLICNECGGTVAADEKWTKMIEGMRIYPPEQIAEDLRKAGFTVGKMELHSKKHWLCIVAEKPERGSEEEGHGI